MRRLGVLLAAALAALTGAGVSAEEAHTTRIVAEPVYGATVTVEHGVNVYRPVPPTTHLIVNSDEAATVILGAATRRITNSASVSTVPAGR